MKSQVLAHSLQLLMFPGLTLASGAAANAASSSSPELLYIGTYTGAKSKGIYIAPFDPKTGKLGSPELAAESPNPTFLALDAKRPVLYAANEIENFGGQRVGAISAFAIDPGSGKLTLLNQQPSGGGGPCHLTVDHSGKCVLTANYGSGSVAALPLEAEGRLRAPSVSIQHHGSSVNRQRQAGPHAHFIMPDPANRFALACDLGLDKVLVYRLAPAEAMLTPADPAFASVKPGAGPRHLAFHPNGRFVYLLNEMGCTLDVFSYDTKRGALTELQTISTLPEDFKGANTCAEVQVHPSGKFVYASNRGDNSIAVFAANKQDGKVAFVQRVPTQGRTPRHFALDPSGQWLLAENQDSDSIVIFQVDVQTGRLTPTGQKVEVGAPVCIVFKRARIPAN